MTSLPSEETKVQDERRKTKILKMMMENIWQLSSFFFIFSVADEKPTKKFCMMKKHTAHTYIIVKRPFRPIFAMGIRPRNCCHYSWYPSKNVGGRVWRSSETAGFLLLKGTHSYLYDPTLLLLVFLNADCISIYTVCCSWIQPQPSYAAFFSFQFPSQLFSYYSRRWSLVSLFCRIIKRYSFTRLSLLWRRLSLWAYTKLI